MTLAKAASFVVSALLGSGTPRALEAFAPFAVNDLTTSMVSTTVPSHGTSRAAASIPIPTSGSKSGAGTGRVSRHQKRSASSNTAPPRFSSGDAAVADISHGHDQQHPHPASAFYFAGDEGAATPIPPPAAQLPSTPAQRDQLPPPAPPEPGGGGGKYGFHSAYNRPWRKRARDARAGTVFENTEGLRSEGSGQAGSGEAMRQRASEKERVVASRRESKKKAMNRAALPIVDLVGIVSPLVIIVGMSLVRNVP